MKEEKFTPPARRNHFGEGEPLTALRFLAWFCPPKLYEGIEGDLLEQYITDAKEKGEKRARRRFLWNVLKFFRPGIILRNKFPNPFINTIVLRNYSFLNRS